MMMSTTCASPFNKLNEQPPFSKNEIFNRNSPFTAILMELAKEENSDAFLPGIIITKLSIISSRIIINFFYLFKSNHLPHDDLLTRAFTNYF